MDTAQTSLDQGPDESALWHKFQIYWSGHLVSSIGDYLSLVALPLAAYNLTSSAIVVAAVDLAEEISTMVFGTSLGAVADRSEPRKILVGSDIARAFLLLVLGVAFALDLGSWQLVAGIAFSLGAFRALHDSAEGGLLAHIVPANFEVKAFARIEISDAIGHLLGSAVAGFATGIGLWFAFGLDAMTFVLAGAAAFGVGTYAKLASADTDIDLNEVESLGSVAEETPKRRSRSVTSTFGARWNDFRESFDILNQSPRYVQLLVIGAIGNFASVCLMGLFIPFSIETLGASDVTVGLLIASGGIGAIVASVLIERSEQIRTAYAATGILLVCSTIALAGIWPTYTTAIITMVASGAGFALWQTTYGSYRLRAFPADKQGRASMASRFILFGSVILALIIGGPVAEHNDPQFLFLIYGITSTAAVVAVSLVKVPVDENVTGNGH